MRRVVVNLSVGFGVLLTGISWLAITLIWHAPLSSLFRAELLEIRILWGSVIGAGAAAIATAVVRTLPGLAGFRRLVHEGFEGIEPRLGHLVLISVVAGWSEELLFRGVLQPLIGVWFTSLAFVVMHGVVRPRSLSGWLLALTLFAGSVGLGYLKRWAGLESAMVAHATYDLVVLLALRWLFAGRASDETRRG